MKMSLLSHQISTFVVLFISYACYTFNRKSASYIAPTLLASGLLTKSGSGVIISSQNTAYAASKFIGGILSDKISASLLLSIGLGISGLATLLYPNTENSSNWAILWFINGLAQGAGWPACSKLLKKWYTPKYFGTLWSLLTGSSNASGTIAPLISSYVLMHYGWKEAMNVAGTMSLGMAYISWCFLNDEPESIGLPDPNALSQQTKSKEKKEIRKDNTSSQMTVRDLLKSELIWIVSISYLIIFASKTVLTDWGTVFLMEKFNKTQLQASSFTSSIESGGFIGNLIAGFVTDKFSSQIKIRGNPRLLISTFFLGTCVASLHYLIFGLNQHSSQLEYSILGALLGASIFGPICIFGIVGSESYPSHLSGTAHAIVALSANLGAIIAGYPVSKLIQIYSWNLVFGMLEIGVLMSIVMIVLSKNRHLQKHKMN